MCSSCRNRRLSRLDFSKDTPHVSTYPYTTFDHSSLGREFIALEKQLALAGESLPEPRLRELQAARLDIEKVAMFAEWWENRTKGEGTER